MEITYENIYRKAKDKTIYQSPAYIEMLVQTLQVTKAHIICKFHEIALPFLTKSTSFGVVYNSLPFFGSCGGLIGANGLCKELEAQIELILSDRNFASMNIVSNWNNPYSFKQAFQDFEIIERINTRKDFENIRRKSQSLMETYHQKTRNIVKLSIRQDFKLIDLSNDLDNVIRLHFDESMLRDRKPKPIEMWEYLFRNTGSNLEYVVYGAIADGEIHGFILYLCDTAAGQVEYFVPCSTEVGRSKNVNYFLIHSSMEDFLRNGFKTFHFGGSQRPQRNLLRFKERWGGESIPYFYYNKYSETVGDLSEKVISTEAPYFFVRPFLNK